MGCFTRAPAALKPQNVLSHPHRTLDLNKGGNQGWMRSRLCPVRTVLVSHFKTKQSPRLCSAALQRLVLDLFPSGVDSSHWCSPSCRGGEEGEVGGGVCCCVHWNSNLERGGGGGTHGWGGLSCHRGPLTSTRVIAMRRCGLTPGLPHYPYPGPPDLLGAPEPGPNPQSGQNPWATLTPEPPRVPPVTQALPTQAPWPAGPTILTHERMWA